MRALRQIPRAIRAAWSVLRDELFLNLPERLRPVAACELDDPSLAKWARWVVVNADRVYHRKADEDARSLAEVTAMHGVVSLALMAMRANSKRAEFSVEGATYKGGDIGDWRVVIERAGPNDTTATTQGE